MCLQATAAKSPAVVATPQEDIGNKIKSWAAQITELEKAKVRDVDKIRMLENAMASWQTKANQMAKASGSNLDLGRAPYVSYGIEYTDQYPLRFFQAAVEDAEDGAEKGARDAEDGADAEFENVDEDDDEVQFKTAPKGRVFGVDCDSTDDDATDGEADSDKELGDIYNAAGISGDEGGSGDANLVADYDDDNCSFTRSDNDASDGQASGAEGQDDSGQHVEQDPNDAMVDYLVGKLDLDDHQSWDDVYDMCETFNFVNDVEELVLLTWYTTKVLKKPLTEDWAFKILDLNDWEIIRAKGWVKTANKKTNQTGLTWLETVQMKSSKKGFDKSLCQKLCNDTSVSPEIAVELLTKYKNNYADSVAEGKVIYQNWLTDQALERQQAEQQAYTKTQQYKASTQPSVPSVPKTKSSYLQPKKQPAGKNTVLTFPPTLPSPAPPTTPPPATEPAAISYADGDYQAPVANYAPGAQANPLQSNYDASYTYDTNTQPYSSNVQSYNSNTQSYAPQPIYAQAYQNPPPSQEYYQPPPPPPPVNAQRPSKAPSQIGRLPFGRLACWRALARWKMA